MDLYKLRRKNIKPKTYTHRCEPAGGGRGNLQPFCHCEASPKGSRGNLIKERLVSYISRVMTKKEIATPERFSVQARIDKNIDCFLA